ncbi:MAG: phasin family protein [Rhodocyclaceae bacterium]|nr:MAG: phasin family protein [Rhodocyclaceae bacterium]
MYATHDEFATAVQANIETSLALANTVFTSVECLTALHLNTARTLFEDGLAGSKALSGAKTIHDVAALQIAMAQPVSEKVIRYSGSTCEIAFQSSGEVSSLVTSQFADMSTNVISGIEKTLNKIPFNWEATSATFTAVHASTKPVQGNRRKISTKAADLADTDVIVATKAAPASRARKAA